MKRVQVDDLPERPTLKSERPLELSPALMRPPDEIILIGWEEDLEKGAQHKYIARYPTGKKKPKWRYVYKYRGSKHQRDVEIHRHSDKLVVGASFKDDDKYHGGHWVVTATDPEIKLEHDETGETQSFKSAHDFRRWLHEAHKQSIEAENKRRREASARDAVASIKVLIGRDRDFDKAPSTEAARKMGNQVKLVRKHAYEAGWGLHDVIKAFGLNDTIPHSWSSLSQEYTRLRTKLLDMGVNLRNLLSSYGGSTVVDAALEAGRVSVIDDALRLAFLHSKIGPGYGEAFKEIQAQYEKPDLSFDEKRKPGARVIPAEMRSMVEQLERTRGELTEEKVLKAIKDRVKDYAYESRARTNKQLTDKVVITGASYGYDDEKKKDIAREIERVALKHGILYAAEPDITTPKGDPEHWESALRDVFNAAKAQSGGEARPEIYSDDWEPKDSFHKAEILGLLGNDPKPPDWYDPDRKQDFIDAHKRLRDIIMRDGDPIVTQAIGATVGGKYQYASARLPLSDHLAAVFGNGTATADKARREHKERWARTEKVLADVEKKVASAALKSTAGEAIGREVSELVAFDPNYSNFEEGVEMADVIDAMRAAIRNVEKNPGQIGRRTGKTTEYDTPEVTWHDRLATESHDVAYDAANAYMETAHPKLNERYQALDWKDKSPEAEKIREDHKELYWGMKSALTLAGNKAFLDELKKAIGHTPDVKHAVSKVYTPTQAEVEASWRSQRGGAPGVADSRKHSDAQSYAYDLAADRGNLKYVLGFIDKSVAPDVHIEEHTKQARAHCTGGNAIRMPADGGRVATVGNRTLWHEYGHAIEHASKGITEAANAIRDERSKGEERRTMNDVDGVDAYRDSEVTYEDKWDQSYTGKWYGHNAATEVLSMGVEEFFSDPAAFLNKDPQHFYFTLAALTGQLGAADKNPHATTRKSLRKLVDAAKAAAAKEKAK
jgi:hypothetical protein